MRIVAKQGESRYLVSVGDDIEKVNIDARARGQVLDVREQKLYPPFNIHSLYARGGWIPCEVSKEQLALWLRDAGEQVPGEGTHAEAPTPRTSAREVSEIGARMLVSRAPNPQEDVDYPDVWAIETEIRANSDATPPTQAKPPRGPVRRGSKQTTGKTE